MSNSNKYYICKRIDEPKRYFGLTTDEIIPVALIVGICFTLGNLLTGIFLAAVVWFLLRHFKKGQGQGWFLNMLYWHLPLYWVKDGFLFTKTPPSSARHWLN